MKTELKIVSAGAGSGKTQDICESIADQVTRGRNPSRIVATTFTRKAAAELKGRIQKALLDRPNAGIPERVEQAEQVELAVTGTVHSVGHQILSRFAISLGLTPAIRVLEEEASTRCLKDLIATMDQALWEDLASLGNRLSMEEMPERVRRLLDAKRSNCIGDRSFEVQMQASADRLATLLSPNGPSPGITFKDLRTQLRRALKAIGAKADATTVTQNAVSDLRTLLASEQETWRDFLKAGNIKAGKKSGADTCLQDLRALAACARQAQGLHDDVRELMRRLCDMVILLGGQYEAYKAERGLVDFADLEVLLLRLLEDPALADALREELDLVVVDEFQDTNPIQLAVFQRLRGLASGSRWVGDPKQAIYGFRGTDPGLVNLVWDRVPESDREPLPNNYRSVKGLVQLFDRLFVPVLGPTAGQKPVRSPADRGIERWVFDTRNKSAGFLALAVGIAQLRQEGTPLKDMAVLTRSNNDARDVAQSLQGLGIPSLLAVPGLLSTRECALTMSGLRLVADPYDTLACASAAHILGDPDEPTPKWLLDRLAGLQPRASAKPGEGRSAGNGPWQAHPCLEALKQIDARTVPPSVVVELVIQGLRIADLAAQWGDTPRRLANLDAIVQLARTYEDEALSGAEAATLPGLISHLDALADEEEDDRPPPYGLEAVTISTYHGAKGLQWPVVILAGLDWDRLPNLWEPDVAGGNAGSDAPLAGRTLRYWPWPFGMNYGSPVGGSGLENDALASPEGQDAQTRERQESVRLLYVGFTRARDKLVLAHRKKNYPWLEAALPNIDQVLDPGLEPGEHKLQGIDTTYVVRRLDDQAVDQYRRQAAGQETWLTPCPERTGPLPALVPRYSTPSQTRPPDTPPQISVERLAGVPIFPTGADETRYAALGNAVHAYLGAIPSMDGLNAAAKRDVALQCLKGFNAEQLLPADRLVDTGDQFMEWIGRTYPGAQLQTEIPVTAPRVGGGQWAGVLDVVLTLPSSEVVIVDHKSAPLAQAQYQAKAGEYAGQIQAYREALEAQGLKVRQAWVHFPLARVLCEIG